MVAFVKWMCTQHEVVANFFQPELFYDIYTLTPILKAQLGARIITILCMSLIDIEKKPTFSIIFNFIALNNSAT